MWEPEPGWVALPGGAAPSTVGVWRAAVGDHPVVIKRLAVPSPHDPSELSDPRHVAYWRREADVLATGVTARTVGLLDRGVLAPGYRADLNVIDFAHLTARAPELAYDLPAGGRRVLQRADGYLHTVVAGVETYASGEETGALPGRLIRGAQPAPAGV